jgi:polysaccharide deacetylase family protein (PEP-CTERM system associated)
MRVLHVATNLELAGAQSGVVEVCAGLARAGVEVHLAYSSRGGRTPGSDAVLVQRARDAGVAVHDLPAMRHGVHPVHDLRALIAVVALARRLRPDLVHTHMSKAGVLARVAAAITGVPRTVHSVRSWSFYAVPPWWRPVAIACERVAARRSDAMLAVSRALAADGTRNRIGAPEAYRVVRSGIDVARFQAAGGEAARRDARTALVAAGIPADAPLVGAVMALVPAKAPLDLVEVARRVVRQRPDVHVAVVGYGPLEGEVAAAIERAGLGDRVHRLGLRADVETLYAGFDVLVATSRWEGLPRVLVEAVAAGVPLVAPDVGGCREVVVDGTGRLAPPGDLDALVDAVVGTLAAPPDRAALTRAAAPILREHDIAQVIADHVDVYRRLARPRHYLGIDLEDWYLDVAGVAVGQAHAARAMDRQLAALLAILDGAATRATFFVLGTTALRYPRWIERIHRAGHEIAAHGHVHRRIGELAPAAFARDVARVSAVLADLTGERPRGYRAPYFSLPADAARHYAILADAGYAYSSSCRGDGRAAHRAGAVVEIPAAALRVGGVAVPVAGGGFWRALPRPAVLAAIAAHERAGRPFAAYLHPHELDPEPLEPRRGPWRHVYVNLGRRGVPGALAAVLRAHRFGPYRDALAGDRS